MFLFVGRSWVEQNRDMYNLAITPAFRVFQVLCSIRLIIYHISRNIMPLTMPNVGVRIYGVKASMMNKEIRHRTTIFAENY